MHYLSTRGGTAALTFADALLSGLAADGGLLLPQIWPQFDPGQIARLAGKSYCDIAFDVLSRFCGEDFAAPDLRADIAAAYAGFDDPAVAPLVELGDNRYLLELFHGPTLAFKDFAMQVLARLFARALAGRNGRATILAATSGDTGSAAIAAFGGLANVELFVLHPKDRISEVQRRQMTTAEFANVHNVALQGSFDDAQAIVKTLLADKTFAHDAALTVVNSINFARIAAQIVYYFAATAKLAARPIFVVPTGNFGDVFAGEAAMRMGLGIERLAIATNANDILPRTFRHGIYAPGAAQHTLSPSMDIQVASNFERALFESAGRDGPWTAQAMSSFAAGGKLELPPTLLQSLKARYCARAINDEETSAQIARFHKRQGRLIDPHTAVAAAMAETLESSASRPVVILSTAHPAKFPDVVCKATGVLPQMPERLRRIMALPERAIALPPEAARVRAHIVETLAR
ncbi:MAG TPA: threonine synthase [Rhizomicrobium sp.]